MENTHFSSGTHFHVASADQQRWWLLPPPGVGGFGKPGFTQRGSDWEVASPVSTSPRAAGAGESPALAGSLFEVLQTHPAVSTGVTRWP